jgi:hypothetical protein
LHGSVSTERLVALSAEPLMAQAVRSTVSKGSYGLRVVPVRGSSERLWLVLSGDGWEPAQLDGYVGRLRRLADLPLSASLRDQVTSHRSPAFARSVDVRAGFASAKVQTVTGDQVSPADGDRVALDTVDPDAATVVCTMTTAKTPEQWVGALEAIGIHVTGTPAITPEMVKLEVHQQDASTAVQAKLDAELRDAAQTNRASPLWSCRVDRVTHHYETTWAQLRGSPTGTLTFGAQAVPDRQIDLVGLYVTSDVPGDAYALIVGDRPADYWYVLPVMIGLSVFGLLFLWALVRVVRREILPRA